MSMFLWLVTVGSGSSGCFCVRLQAARRQLLIGGGPLCGGGAYITYNVSTYF